MELSILTHQHCSEFVSHSLLNLFAKSWASFQKNEAMAHRQGGWGWIITWSLLVLLISYCREGELWGGGWGGGG